MKVMKITKNGIYYYANNNYYYIDDNGGWTTVTNHIKVLELRSSTEWEKCSEQLAKNLIKHLSKEENETRRD